MDYDKFIESKIAFINEFLNSTRPAYELADFMKAFDTIVFRDNDVPESQPTLDFVPEIPEVVTPTPIVSDKPEEKPTRKYRTKKIVLNDGTRLNVHPASKMVKVSFFDRDTYYSSVTAAAQALGVSLNVVNRAAKKRTRINGHDVEYVNPSDLRSAPKKG